MESSPTFDETRYPRIAGLFLSNSPRRSSAGHTASSSKPKHRRACAPCENRKQPSLLLDGVGSVSTWMPKKSGCNANHSMAATLLAKRI